MSAPPNAARAAAAGALLARLALGLLQRARLGLAGAADRFDRAARLAGFFRDLGVLLGDDRLGRLVAVEAAERGGRNAAVRALRAVFVINVEQHEFADRTGAWFASHVVVPFMNRARPALPQGLPQFGPKYKWIGPDPHENAGPGRVPDMALKSGGSMPGFRGVRHQDRLVAERILEHALEVFHLRRVVEDDVGIVRMQGGVVLVIGLGRIERGLHGGG